MKPYKIYYYIVMWTNGNMVAGYRIEKDTSLETLGKKWLKEHSGEVTPIMEGIEFKRPKPKPDPFAAIWGNLPIIVNRADKKSEKKAKKK